MTKFHISKNGKPAICRATKGNCPLGGADSHFDSAEEAQAHSDKMMEEEYGIMMNYVDNESASEFRVKKYSEVGEIAKENIADRISKDGKELLEVSSQKFQAKDITIERDNSTGKYVADRASIEISTSYMFEQDGEFGYDDETETLEVSFEEQEEFDSEEMAQTYVAMKIEDSGY